MLQILYDGSSTIGDLLTIFPSLVANGRGTLVAEFFKAHVDEVGSPP
jgi:hypothetical protein